MHNEQFAGTELADSTTQVARAGWINLTCTVGAGAFVIVQACTGHFQTLTDPLRFSLQTRRNATMHGPSTGPWKHTIAQNTPNK